MAFSGLSTNTLFTPNLIGEDISPLVVTLAPVEAPFLDWLGDADVFATSTKHEYIQDYLRPNYITVSTAVNSATAATGITIAGGLGTALTVGTLLENETSAEVMQITSIPGANSILVARNFDGSGIGSLAAGGELFVRAPAGLEGADHSGANAQRLGSRVTNTVGLFQIEISASGTELAVGALGRNSYADNRAKVFREVPFRLETEIVRGVLNNTNSLGTSAATRTMKGIRSFVTAINSSTAANSIAATPSLLHTHLGDVFEQMYKAGASTAETWGIYAGRTAFKYFSNLNDSFVEDSNQSETFKRVIRRYAGPFGDCTVFLGRSMPAGELLIVPRERVKVVPLQGRSFAYMEMGKSGDNTKGMVVGEYTVEVHHPDAMGRLRLT